MFDSLREKLKSLWETDLSKAFSEAIKASNVADSLKILEKANEDGKEIKLSPRNFSRATRLKNPVLVMAIIHSYRKHVIKISMGLALATAIDGSPKASSELMESSVTFKAQVNLKNYFLLQYIARNTKLNMLNFLLDSGPGFTACITFAKLSIIIDEVKRYSPGSGILERLLEDPKIQSLYFTGLDRQAQGSQIPVLTAAPSAKRQKTQPSEESPELVESDNDEQSPEMVDLEEGLETANVSVNESSSSSEGRKKKRKR